MSNPISQRIFLLLFSIALVFVQGCAPPQDVQAATQRTRSIPVTVIAAQERPFEERITLQGSLLPKEYAMVSPMVDGIVTDVYVEEGDRVVANETKLVQIEKITLTQAYDIACQDQAVAEHACRDAEAQAIAAQVQYDKAKIDYERFVRLREQQAITPDAMEQMEAGFKVAEAQLNRAKTAVALRKEQQKQAAAAVIIARKRLDDSLVISPMDGWITMKTIKRGEFASVGRAILRIADTSVLEVSAFLPGEYYPRIRTGETRMRIQVSGIDVGTLPITYKSPEIMAQLRTFEVKALIESPPEGVVPGAMAQIETVLQSRDSLGVPHDVTQIRDGKTVVFVVENGLARQIEIHTGLTTAGWTEVLGDALAPGTPVISRGYNLVNDGDPVDVQEEAK